jgi:ribosomal protein uS13
VARIAGVNLPNQKRLEVGLTYIYGIGRSTAQKICSDTGLSQDEKIKDLTDEEITKLREYIDGNLQVEGDLRRERTQAIKRLGRGLIAVAWAPDQIVEGAEFGDPARFVLGVQWHPEELVGHSEPARRLFAALVAAARKS